MSSTKTQFLNRIKPGCYLAWQKVGILPSVAAAQTILESGWGKSTLASQHNNYWGVKSFNPSEPRVAMTTKEHYGGRVVTIVAYFRKYASIEDGFLNGYAKTLGNQRYKKAWGVKDARTQITYIKQAGYATDVSYVNLIMGMIENNPVLKSWDAHAIAGGTYTGPTSNAVISGDGGGYGGAPAVEVPTDPQGFYTFDSSYIETNQYTRPGHKLSGVVGIVLRDAGSPGLKIPSIKSNLAKGNGSKKKGFHILIDKTDTTCIVPLNEVVYHSDATSNLLDHLKASSSKVPNGNMNLTTISIGICRESDGTFANETTARLIAVVSELLNHYNLPEDCVYTGTTVDGSWDPLPYYENFFDFSTMLGLVKYQRNQDTPMMNENLQQLMDSLANSGGSGTPVGSDVQIQAGTGARAKVMALAQEMMGWNMMYSQPKRSQIRRDGYSDCSSFTQYVYKNTIGIDPGITTHYQVRNGQQVPRHQALPGDLVHWKGHVGIVADVGAIHCIHSGVNGGRRGNIKYAKIDGVRTGAFIGIRRYFNEQGDAALLAGGGTSIGSNPSTGGAAELDASKDYFIKAIESLTIYAGDSNNSTSVRKLGKGSEVQVLSTGAFAFRIGDGEWIKRSDSAKFEMRSTDKKEGSHSGYAKIIMQAPVKTAASATAPAVTQQGSRKILEINNTVPVYGVTNNMLRISPPTSSQQEWIPAVTAEYQSKLSNMERVTDADFVAETPQTSTNTKPVRFIARHASGMYDAILGLTPTHGTIIGHASEYRIGSTVGVTIPQYASLNGSKQINGLHQDERDVVYIYLEDAAQVASFGVRLGNTRLISGGK